MQRFQTSIVISLLTTLLTAVTVTAQEAEELLAEPQYLDVAPLRFTALDSDELLAQIRVTSGRTNAAFGFNTPEVVTYLPPFANSHYARFEFSETTLQDARGASIPYAYNTGYDENQFAMDLRFEREDYDGYPSFVRAGGVITIDYPLTIHTIAIAAGDAAAQARYGLRIEGPFVYDQGLLTDRAISDGSLAFPGPVRAYDADGRLLRRTQVSMSVIWEAKVDDILGFYGEIARIEVDTVTSNALVNVVYDLPAAPELPATQAGMPLSAPFPYLSSAKVIITLADVLQRKAEVVEASEASPSASPAEAQPEPLPAVARVLPKRHERMAPDTHHMTAAAAAAALAELGFAEVNSDAFFQAVAMDNLEASALFLAAGADPNAPGEQGLSAAMLASMMAHADIMLLMLEAGVDPNARDSGGLTPLLRFARDCNAADVVERLLSLGADPNAEVSPDIRPLGMAQTMQCTDNARLLQQAGAR